MKQITAAFLVVGAVLPLAAPAGNPTFKAPLSGATVAGTLSGAACEASAGGTSRVEFFLGSAPLNVDVASPWNCLLDTTLFTNGSHALKAVAYDKRGRASSAQITINIDNGSTTAPPPPPPPSGPTPYFGTPISIPATIEAENFDKGGESVAYHDNVAGNAGGQYRTSEDVDIIVSADAAGGGYVINNFETGEWMKYTISVPATGNYDLALRVASTATTSAFHVEVDGVDVTGRITVPATGSWNTFQWVTAKTGLPLAAGTHVLRVVADAQYFNFNSLSISTAVAAPPPPPPPSGSTPYSGTPVAVPATIEAENFDKGGEGVAYHDNVAGNAGGQYRTGEDVDIIVSADSAGGGYVVNNFETGEWMKYTINVPTAGNYDLALRVSTSFTTSAFRVEVDGVDVTGRISVPSTGSWSAFQWVTAKTGLPLAAGDHVLRVVADQQYFNLNSLRVSTPEAAPPPPPPSAADFFCTFPNSATDCGFREQAKVPGRATLASIGRDGSTSARLHTEPGDNSVNGSGTWERNDLSLGTSASYCNPGQEEWWAHSVLFPDDYVFPPGPGAGIVMDFHHSGSSGQANFELQTIPTIGLRLRGYGGATVNGGMYQAEIADPYGAPRGAVVKNRWYDFVYHIKWSPNSDGFAVAWLNGKRVLSYNGPTLYAGMTCYLKLANYHAAFGEPSSVIHDRVVRGTSASAVSLTPLEGVP
jgi:hypothetical protein